MHTFFLVALVSAATPSVQQRGTLLRDTWVNLGWAGACSGVENCTLTAAPTKVVAAFASGHQLVVANVGAGEGLVRSSPAGIDCENDCSELFPLGTEVTLTVEPSIGSRFAGWGGPCTGTQPCVVTTTEAMLVTATFEPDWQRLEVSIDGRGGQVNVQGVPCRVKCEVQVRRGTAVFLPAVPDSGWRLKGWSGACMGQLACRVTVNQATELTATFERISNPPLTVMLAGTGSGTITTQVGPLDCRATCTGVFPPNSSVTLTALPTLGSRFVGWSGGRCNGLGFCALTIDGPTVVTATFERDEPLSISPASARLSVSERISFTGVGGLPPYTFTLTSGRGGLDHAGEYNAPGVAGFASVTVTDARFDRATASIEIGPPPFLSSAASLVLDGGAFSDVVVGDWDRDGRQDLAVAHARGVNTWLASSGAAGWFERSAFTTNGAVTFGAASLAKADWDRDGRLDLAFTQPGSREVTVLRGAGDGTFAPAGSLSVASAPIDLASGDLDRDGWEDLVIACQSSVDVFRGQPDGGFLRATPTSLPVSPVQLVMGDWNRDGLGDVAMTTTGNAVYVLLGTGAGRLGPITELPLGVGGQHLASGDLDDDGDLDLAVSNSSSGVVQLFAGNGAGSFSARPSLSGLGRNPGPLVLDYWNGDGTLDLLITDTVIGVSSSVLLAVGRGDGTFFAPVSVTIPRGVTAVVAADFNRDARPDLATVSALQSMLTVLHNTTPRTVPFVQRGAVFGAVDVADVLGGDWNRDGHDDLVWTDATTLWWAADAGSGVSASLPAGPTVRLAAADFDRDGRVDVVRLGPSGVRVERGGGDGTFAPGSLTPVGTQLEDVASGDWNRDGKPDLALCDRASNVKLLLGAGDGGFEPPSSVDAGVNPIAVVTADWNRDGRDDLAVAHASGDRLHILLGVGDGTFTAAAPVQVGAGQRALATVDWNRDAKPDLLVTRAGSADVQLLLGQGDGTFAPPLAMSCHTEPMQLLEGDWNGDGLPDFIAAHATGNVSYFMGLAAPGVLPSPVLMPSYPGHTSLVRGDWNGDGVDDAAMAHSFGISLMMGTP